MEGEFRHTEIDISNFKNYFCIGMPSRLDEGGLCLCRSGEADIVIDMKQYRITKGDMIVAFPFSVLQILRISDDFRGFLIGSDLTFFANIKIPDKSSYYLYIKDNPCISMTVSEAGKILTLFDYLLRENEDRGHPLRAEINESILRIIAYEIAAIYLKRKPLNQQPRSRSTMIFQKFIFSLFSNSSSQRSLEHFALEQSITPRHLSMVVRRVSGQTAGEWINNCMILNMKAKLQNETLTIRQISEEMNFPNPSFFSQYFRKYTGISPREFRIKSRRNFL